MLICDKCKCKQSTATNIKHHNIRLGTVIVVEHVANSDLCEICKVKLIEIIKKYLRQSP